MKELCIQVCTRVRLMIEVTEEMERDLYECWDMANQYRYFKKVAVPAAGMDRTLPAGTSACEIVAERGSREGR